MAYPIPELREAQTWFLEAKFGIFVHFGLYTLHGGNENDFQGKTPRQYREELMPQFNPVGFDAEQWVQRFARAGAKYLALTTKHGEGFCLWHTQTTDYNVSNTPFKRDIVREIADACHKANMRLGLYCASDNWYYQNSSEYPQTAEAYSEFLGAQLRELMTNYGQVDLLWLDGSTPLLPTERLQPLLRDLHELQPSLVVNDRGVDHDQIDHIYGDLITPERFFPSRLRQPHPYIEVCDAMGQKGWGYHNDQHFQSAAELIHRLCQAAAYGGNYLLNVEPQPDGVIRPECLERLDLIEEWLQKHADSIFDTTECSLRPFEPWEQNLLDLGCCTRRDKRVYIHLRHWPRGDEVRLRGLKAKPQAAAVQDTSLRVTSNEDEVLIRRLPALGADNSVIRLDLSEPAEVTDCASPNDGHTTPVEPTVPTLLRATVAELLPSADGMTHHQVERYTNGTTSIGRWVRRDSAARWSLEVERAGKYRLYAYFGCGEAQADAVAVFRVGSRELTFRTVATGSYRNPVGHDIGILELSAGEQALELSCREKRQFFPNVHHLLLAPIIEE